MTHRGWRSLVVGLVFVVASSALGHAQTGALTPAQERAVLMELYQAAGGPKWSSRQGWGSDRPICQWEGVRCTSPLADHQVASLTLPRNRLRGTIPASLATLPWLHTLDLSGNPLRGAVPPPLIDRANRNELELRIGGTTLNEALTSVTIQVDAVTGVCYGDLKTRMVIDAVRQAATIEALRCQDDPKSEQTVICVRGTTRAPGLDVVARALRRLGVAGKNDHSSRSDLLVSDHDIEYATTFTFGDGTAGDLATVWPYGPLDTRIAQSLLLHLVPEPRTWKAREVGCKSLLWAGEGQL